MATEVKVPALGESVTEATVGQWLKKPGDAVKVDEPIASLETDKVAVEVPSPVAGVFGEQLVKEGDTVNVGAVIATIEAGGAGCRQGRQRDAGSGQGGSGSRASPRSRRSARSCPDARLLRRRPPRPKPMPARSRFRLRCAAWVLEHGLDPSRIPGSGKDGRLTKDDVMARHRCGHCPCRGARQRRAGGRRLRWPVAPSGARQDDAPAPDRRQAAQGSAEQCRDPHHLQRCRHDCGHPRRGPSIRICSRRSMACASASWASS